jgi:hypothetical protein
MRRIISACFPHQRPRRYRRLFRRPPYSEEAFLARATDRCDLERRMRIWLSSL